MDVFFEENKVIFKFDNVFFRLDFCNKDIGDI